MTVDKCTHDSAQLKVTSRERVGANITWVLVVCQCGQSWQMTKPAA